jgi:hypothetical protein
MLTNKNEVALLLQHTFFSIVMQTKGIIVLWPSFLFTGPIFHTISLPAL